ncbi:MAG TPA: NAD-dependent epimerase/dehydratase family protein [Micromonosporaceae bacterium]|nr:NAD-dependent epimerase/dehydratase family protein [Micromonosporaceae bacterium]
MSLHVIVGAGPVGSSTASLLASRGEQVRLISRDGAGPDHPRVERVAADAAQPKRLRELSEEATAIYNCANPDLRRWPIEWPPLMGALLHAAESSGAVLANAGSLYVYGPVNGPITEETPMRPSSTKGAIRARLWHDALEAHRAGRIRTTEVRASDYVGPGHNSLLNQQVVPKVVAGEPVVLPADLDAPHSWTYIGDTARMLVAAATDERAWGRPWLVPTPPPASLRDVASRVADFADAPAPKLSTMSRLRLWFAGLFDRQARELREVAYQFERPFVVDSSAATSTFGIQPTPLDDALRETVRTTANGG